jgi:hypothetical protein
MKNLNSAREICMVTRDTRELNVLNARGCTQKFPDWPPGAKTANGTELSATRCSCIAILCVSLVTFAAINLCVASQRVFIVISVYFFINSVRTFWIHLRTAKPYELF